MSFSVVGRHSLGDIRPRFEMPLQEAAADLGISVNSLKRICRKFGIPKWPYRQRFSLMKHRQKLQDAMDGSTEEDLPALQLHYEQVNSLLAELDERGFTDPAHMSSLSDHDIGSPISSEVLEEHSSVSFSRGTDDHHGSAFGKRRYSSSSLSSDHADLSTAMPSPSKKHAKAFHPTFTAPQPQQPLQSLQPKSEKPISSKTETKSGGGYSSLELLAQIATQQPIHEGGDPHAGAPSCFGHTAAATSASSQAYKERPLSAASPSMHPPASDAMLAGVVYAAQQNVHQLARRVHALENSLYYFVAVMQQQQQLFQQASQQLQLQQEAKDKSSAEATS